MILRKLEISPGVRHGIWEILCAWSWIGAVLLALNGDYESALGVLLAFTLFDLFFVTRRGWRRQMIIAASGLLIAALIVLRGAQVFGS